jgi:beta-galactosidase
MISEKLPRIWYGGDYNPDQWPEEVWQEDMRLFRKAGINVATLPVFSWAKLQPQEDRWDFSWLDRALDLLSKNGMYACIATSTGAVPPWLATKYPEVLRTNFNGMRRKYGHRHNACPTSPVFRRLSVQLARKLAERYASHPALVAWHVSNEYGGRCYCEGCEKAFRGWLRKRYGTLDALNQAWWTGFWGHTFTDWDQIVLPSILSEHTDAVHTAFQGITLDHYRFASESLMECFCAERDALHEVTPGVKVTTNLMGAYKELDYFRWAREMDIVSWDNYPALDTPTSEIAFRHDLMRGLKGGAPFMLMEQTPSQVNWQDYNGLKRPGVMRLMSLQAVAHGADTVMFFQLRRTRGASEKYHSAVIDHAGHENTRVFREVAALGAELETLGSSLLDSRMESRIGILFDWENWWAIEMSSGPSVALKYVQQVSSWHAALWEQNYAMDVVGVEDDFSRYDIIIAPVLYMVKPGMAGRLEAFVSGGGTFLTTFFSGYVNESDLVTVGGYPGELRKLLGIWVEEIDALLPSGRNSIRVKMPLGDLKGSYECGLLCDILHCETAEELAVYGSDFYAGTPSVTRNRFGKGWAWYVASSAEPRFLTALTRMLAREKGVQPVAQAPRGVEATCRKKGKDSFLFLLNHADVEARVELGSGKKLTDLSTGKPVRGAVQIPAKGAVILREA